MSQSARHHRRKGEQFRTPGRVAPSPEAIAKRLRQDPPKFDRLMPFGPQALWEQEQQRLAREAADGLHNDGCECRRCADGPWQR